MYDCPKDWLGRPLCKFEPRYDRVDNPQLVSVDHIKALDQACSSDEDINAEDFIQALGIVCDTTATSKTYVGEACTKCGKVVKRP